VRGKIFDTNKLIKQWRQSRKRPLVDYSKADAESWAKELIEIYKTNFILTPVYLEVVGGVVDRHEMELIKAFLNVFLILDEGRIKPEDWTKARQLAERISIGSRPRGAIDCLIKAIAIRLRCDILTDDGGMPRHLS
jgi:predicted nucleic acid-binding protein